MLSFLKALTLLLTLDWAAAFNPCTLATASGRQLRAPAGCERLSGRHQRRSALDLWMKDSDDELQDENLSDEERKKLEDFRSKLMGQFTETAETPAPAPSAVPAPVPAPAPAPAAEPEGPLVQRAFEPAPGRVLVANPENFFSNNPFAPPVRDLGRFNLRGPPDPRNYFPDQYANLLPVLLLVDYEKGKPSKGVLMERRTGALMGDLEMKEYGCIAISPLWMGGQELTNATTMIHNVPDIRARELGEGLFEGGWEDAKPRLSNASLAEGRFKFYLGSTTWQPGQLEDEIKSGAWFVLKVAPEIFLKDRIADWVPGRPKPVWRDLMKLVEGDEDVTRVFTTIYPESFSARRRIEEEEEVDNEDEDESVEAEEYGEDGNEG